VGVRATVAFDGHHLDVGAVDRRVQLVEAAFTVGVVDRQVGERLHVVGDHVLDDAGDHEPVGLRRLEDPAAVLYRLDYRRRCRQADVRDRGLLYGVDYRQAVGRDGAADDDVDVVLLDQPVHVRDSLGRVRGGVEEDDLDGHAVDATGGVHLVLQHAERVGLWLSQGGGGTGCGHRRSDADALGSGHAEQYGHPYGQQTNVQVSCHLLPPSYRLAF